MHICLHMDDVVILWELNNRADFVAQSFLESRLQYELSEGLTDFLVFLVNTSRQNKQKLIKGIPTFSLRIHYKILGLSTITFALETPGCHSRALVIHITA